MLLRLSFACLSILVPLIAFAASDGKVTLSRNGTSDYVIVLPDTATPVERTAASELQSHLLKVTGARLPIIAEADVPGNAPRIVVGDSPLARRLLGGLDPAKLAPDAIVIKTVGDNLVLVGHPRRGTLYAVYTFLEDMVGIRWWTTTATRIPKRPTLAIAACNVTYAPKLAYRAARYFVLHDETSAFEPRAEEHETARPGVFPTRLKLNGYDPYAGYSIPAEYGGRDSLLGWVHTFYDNETLLPPVISSTSSSPSKLNGLMPPAKYFKEHPEWYSLWKGKRRDKGGQLCLTNEEMRRELVRNVLDQLRKNPDATMISVSQNDNSNWCQCDRCREAEEREGGLSGLLITFVNSVAEKVEREYPTVFVQTLAYQRTRTPPKSVRPRHNVIVQLCSLECSFAEPLDAGEQNRHFYEDIEGWSRIAARLYIWDYVSNFQCGFIPFPNMHVLAPNLRCFVKHHAVGVFEQGDGFALHRGRIGPTGEFVRLRVWLLAHLLWNPDADEKQLVNEFLTGYYGAAAPYLSEYLSLMSSAVRRSGTYLGYYSGNTKDTTKWLTLDDLSRATRLFGDAVDAVQNDPVLCERVRRERLPVDVVWLQRYDEFKHQAVREGREFLGPQDPVAACEEFLRVSEKYGASGILFEKLAEELRLKCRQSIGREVAK